MILTGHEKTSEAWRKIYEYYAERLVVLRAQNDAKMSEADRNFHLGRLAEVKGVLALHDDPVKTE
jgi:hypothetical protein